MPLPTINSVNPTSTLAVGAMDFNEAFLTLLHFYAPEVSGKWSCQMSTRNYNAASGVLAPDTPSNKHSVKLDDVAAYAAMYPVFAQTLGAVLVVAGKVMEEQKAKSDLSNAESLPDGDGKVAALIVANAALSAAKVALGAS